VPKGEPEGMVREVGIMEWVFRRIILYFICLMVLLGIAVFWEFGD
jgi:hypothetical protein